jgi:predicted patatin/cPLA2 family phospholipase
MGVIIYVAGGAMSAVFSAGVLHRLRDMQLPIDAVYAVSAGAVNSAYFLADQSHELLPLYTEDLCTNKTVQTRNLLSLWRTEPKDVLNVDYGLELMRTRRALDVAAVQKNAIPFFAKVFNVDTEEIEYLPVHDDVFTVLHATTAIAPFYTKPVVINGKRYIDGAVRESIGVQRLLEKHPDDQIIVILNSAPTHSLRGMINNTLWRTLLRSLPHDQLYRSYCAMEQEETTDIRCAIKEERVLLLHPSPDFSVTYTTTDPKLVHEGFRMGYAAAERITHFVTAPLQSAPDALVA